MNYFFPLEILENGFTKRLKLGGGNELILLGGSPRTKRLSLATTLNLDIRNIIFAILHLDSIPQTEEKLSKVLKKKISELVFQRNGKHNKHFFFRDLMQNTNLDQIS